MIDKRTTRICDYYGEKNPNAKLTEPKVKAIREMYSQGHKPKALALVFGVSRSNISNIVAKRIWRHI